MNNTNAQPDSDATAATTPESHEVSVAVVAEAPKTPKAPARKPAAKKAPAVKAAAAKPAAKPVTKSATKPAAKRPAKALAGAEKAEEPKAAPKASAKRPVKAAAKAPAVVAEPSMETAKPAKESKVKKPVAKKTKLVRDSFTFPEGDYELIGVLKQRALNAGREIKKSELLRAGLAALVAMSESDLVVALDGVERIKTGRPSK